MRAENRDGAGGHFIGFLDKDDAFVGQILHHMRIMDNFMPDIDRRAEFGEGLLDNFDGALYSGAKPSRLGENNFHGHQSLAEYKNRPFPIGRDGKSGPS